MRPWSIAMLLVAALTFPVGCHDEADDDSGIPGDDDTTAGGDDDSAPAAPVGYWTSADGIFDEHGRQRLLRGINVPTQDSEATDMELIASWGNNVVRQMYFWADVEPTEGQYDEDFLSQIDRQVELARDAGLLVLIDHHQHCYGAGFGCWGMPAWTCDEQYYQQCEDDPWNYFCDGMETCFELFWTGDDLKRKYIDHLVMLAQRYADEPAVIGFDVINEPYCMHTTLEECGVLMAEFYSDAAARIREVAPDKLIFFEPNFIELVGLPTNLAGLDLGDKGVYAAHYYLMEVHDGGDYDLDPSLLQFNIDLRASEAAAFDMPLFVGEYGGMASVANFTQYIDDNLDIFDVHRAGSALWLYAEGDGFHILDSEGEPKAFVDAYVRPYPRSTPGTVSSLEYDLDTRILSLTFESDGTIAEPGDLFVPQMHYSGGFVFEGCDAPGCTWQHDVSRQAIEFVIGAAGEYHFRLTP